MASAPQGSVMGLSGPISFGAGLALLALAPLIRGGNRHVALIALEWLGLLVLLLLGARWLGASAGAQVRTVQRLGRMECLVLLSPVWAAAMYLTPIPAALWTRLAGRDVFAGVVAGDWMALSLTPDATLASLLAAIPLVAAYALARLADAAQVAWLAVAWVAAAVLQAVWGLAQIGLFEGLYFGAEFPGAALGSFGNSNHFANFIAMALPAAVVMLDGRARGGQGRARFQVFAAALSLLILLAAVLASGSRAGAAIAFVVVAASLLLLVGQTVDERRRRWVVPVGLIGLALATAVAVERLLARVQAANLGEDALLRWQVVKSTLDAAATYWPWGSGPGSFAAAYPRFQPAGLNYFVEYAHNDYAQLLLEAGLLYVVLALLAGGLVLRQGLALWRQARERPQRGVHRMLLLQLACGLGMLAMVLHGLVDFSLRIPANAILFTTLAGVFMRRPEAVPARLPW